MYVSCTGHKCPSFELLFSACRHVW